MQFGIMTAHAASPGVAEAQAFVADFNSIILFPFIGFLTAVAVLIFIYGGFEYIIHADNSAAREQGRKHLMWGIVGLFVMLVAFGILSIAAGTFGLNDELNCADNPDECDNTVFEIPSA
jgi:fructose-specific phosphotransferase system IIC component